MRMQGPGRPRHNDVLSAAEWRVVELVRHGLTNRRIAASLGVSLDAVKFHVSNALGKLGFAGRDQLRRWDGVSKGSAMHGSMGMGDPDGSYVLLGQIARNVRSTDASRAWYRDILGLPELYAFPGLAFFDLGGVRLMLTEEESGAGTSQSLIYLRVPEIRGAKERLEARGVRFTHAPHMIHRHENGTEEWMAFFEDDEGRPLALMSQVRSAAG